SAQEFLRALEDYAIGARLMASQLRFGAFLTEHFAKQIVDLRRERERAAAAFTSEIPPAPLPGDEEEAPTTVSDASALFETAQKDVDHAPARGRLERSPRVWSEPGAIDGLDRPLDSGKVALHEPGN